MKVKQAKDIAAQWVQAQASPAPDFFGAPFFFSTMIGDFARPIAIEGSRAMIASGQHREAAFWIALVHTLCQKAVATDGSSADQSQVTPGYERLVSAFGLASLADRQQRIEQLPALLSRVWEATEAMRVANPNIGD